MTNLIYLHRDRITRRWCIIDRTRGFIVLSTFDTQAQARAALAGYRTGG